MSAGAPPGWVDVRRLFTRFIVLVVVPSVGLVGFGVLAINNERAAVEQRFKDQYSDRLRSLAEHLVGTLESTAAGLSHGVPKPSELVQFGFTAERDKLVAVPSPGLEAEAALAAHLKGLVAPADGSVSLIPIRSGPARGLYAVVRLPDDSLRGMAFSELGLSISVARDGARRFPGEQTHFSMEGATEPSVPASSSLRAMLEAVTSDHGEQGTVSLPMPAPLTDWRIVATLPGNDPVRTALWRNRTIYIVILALFYLVITIGVIVTLRGIWREAHLSRMKTDFVSNLSHELRTPLTSIRMFAETLRMGRATTPEEQAACIDFIAKESERLSDIAERTLDWARLEAGRRPFVRARISPARITQDIVAGFLSHGMVEPEAIRVEVPDTLPQIDVDRAAIGQVLLNLLENAVKYSGPEKHIVVRGRLHRGAVLIEVEDNGIGVARKDLRRIFERFYRADDLLARRTEGSGLGLSIARRIVLAHDGRLTVQSKLGVGSVFTIQLPAAVAPDRAARPAESHA